MKPEEALRNVLESLDEDESYRIYGGLKQVVVDALEKQIPKKIEFVEPYDLHGGHCPECKKNIYITGADFCPNCGQRLDYGEA